jgi:3-phenylpropionate/trans-cinnamate dioxygenase ferredoxin reductase subunit
MTKLCTITVGARAFTARPGERLLDAALLAGCDLPHDCRAGQCGSCVVDIEKGLVLGGEAGMLGRVRACQAVVLSDLRVRVDAVPPVRRHTCRLVALRRIVADVAELTLLSDPPLVWRPGQYANVTFDGYPARAYSPTVALDGRDAPGTFRLHIRLRAGGRVSGAIGGALRVGHRVTVEGPHGSAFLRAGRTSRLVLFAGGTGFAPIWSIADGALRENASRPMVVVVGVRTIRDFYMAEALERMARCPSVAILPVVAEPQSLSAQIRCGAVTDLAGIMQPGDEVHAAGGAAMVDGLARRAEAVGAVFHADRFVPSAAPGRSLLARARDRISDLAGKAARPRDRTSAPALPTR